MALRDQPYLPLYVQDYLTDENLNMCSPASQGVYIKIMCVLHKQKEYGSILLKQREKQNSSTSLNFAEKFAKLLPFNAEVINDAIIELVDEEVLIIEDDKLYQKRMVKDNQISEKRAKAGSKGGKKTQFAKANAKAKSEANPENENEYENENVIVPKRETYLKIFDDIMSEKDFHVPFPLIKPITKWLKYKSEKGQTYKSTGLKSFINKLTKLSNSDGDIADLIIEQSMSNNWAGIFELKNEKIRTGNKNRFASDTTRNGLESLQNRIKQKSDSNG